MVIVLEGLITVILFLLIMSPTFRLIASIIAGILVTVYLVNERPELAIMLGSLVALGFAVSILFERHPEWTAGTEKYRGKSFREIYAMKGRELARKRRQRKLERRAKQQAQQEAQAQQQAQQAEPRDDQDEL